MKLVVVKDYDEMSKAAFDFIKNEIASGASSFGMATGSTPVGLYKLICEDYKTNKVYEKLNYYNLDEYHGLNQSHSQSYYSFMKEMLFDKINVSNFNIPNSEDDISKSINDYQNIIDNANIDVQILGIGANAHIGFNEPGTPFDLKTNFVKLKNTTREANKRFFDNNIDEVPEYAITMGISDIMKSKKILLIANGESKATAIYNMFYGKVDEQVPASILQNHPDVTVIIDVKAASKLPLHTVALDISSTRIKIATFDKQMEQKNYEVIDHDNEDIYEKALELTKRHLTSDVSKIGLSISGYTTNGIVSHPVNKMHSFDIKSRMEQDLGYEVTVINRANASAYGEYMQNFNSYSSLYYISLATGIGGGYVANGQLVNGRRGLSGEISNMIIDAHEFNDNFFADGSIEMHYNTYKLTNNRKLFVKQMGIVVANIVNTIDPDVIVIDLKNKDLDDNLISEIEDATNNLLYDVHSCGITIEHSTLVDESLLGIAMYASKGS